MLYSAFFAGNRFLREVALLVRKYVILVGFFLPWLDGSMVIC